LVLYLFKLGYEIPKPYIILILFKGLFSSYNSFYFKKYKNISRNIKNININKFILDIINESIKLGFNISGLVNKLNNNKFKYYIYYKNNSYNSKDHLEKICYYKYLNNKNKKSKFIKNNDNKYKNESTKTVMRVKSMIIIYKPIINNNINNIKNQYKII
jgi:hypothetical protein